MTNENQFFDDLEKSMKQAVEISKSRRVVITPEIRGQILRLAGTDNAQETLEQAVNMYQMLMDAQKSGSKFYEVDANGEKYLVKFI